MHKYRFTPEKIARRLALISQHILSRHYPISPFEYLPLSGPNADFRSVLDRIGHVIHAGQVWGDWQTNFVLKSHFQVPSETDERLSLYLPIGEAGDFSHPEALVYIDGEAVAACDRHHQLIKLPRRYYDNQIHDLVLHGWTGLGGFEHVPLNRRLFMGQCAVVAVHEPTREFYHLAKAAYDTYLMLHDDDPTRHNLLHALDYAVHMIDFDNLYGTIHLALNRLRDDIRKAGPAMDVDLWALGHAHIDVAWLWTVDEVRLKAGRTFATVLDLMNQYPQYRFTQSQPQLYAFIERDYPEIFAGISQRIEEGRWEPLGGMWVEADCNISGAEALARQFVLGRRYFAERFGHDAESPILWLPDVFGYPASLPQLIKEAGLEYFFTIKISWNQQNPMPYDSFWWRGLDGTRVLSHFSSTPEAHAKPERYTYNAQIEAQWMLETWRNVKHKDIQRDVLVSYGYGDGGGGPTSEMIENIALFHDFPGLPRMHYSSALDFFKVLDAHSGGSLPTWTGELYLEFHRGTYTSQARTKRGNRKSEVLLHDAEFMAALAQITEPSFDYPHEILREAWELLCLNQFHDILPGSSITPVYEDALRDYDRIRELGAVVQDQAATVLRKHYGGDVIVINPSPAMQTQIVFVEGMGDGQILRDRNGYIPASQPAAEGMWISLPMSRYAVRAFELTSGSSGMLEGEPVNATRSLLENGYLRVELNRNGDITRIFDKQQRREILPPRSIANQFQAFDDRPLDWDAWDIDIFYDEKQWLADPAISIEVIEQGPLRATIEIKRRILNSTYIQHITLTHSSPLLRFDTQIDWQERHKLLKVAFPVDIHATEATYDIQWGHVRRPTYRNTSWDWARFETVGHKWADLSEGNYGVSLLNDCKYGYDIHDNVMRLSLLRSPTFPDPSADQGRHEFTYALLPHRSNDLQETVRAAYGLNDPCIVLYNEGTAQTRHPLLHGPMADTIIETVKWAENDSGLILRLYENGNSRQEVRLQMGFDVKAAWRTNLLEERQSRLDVSGKDVLLPLRPFEVATVLVVPQ